jgi:glycine cleavage system H protein
VTENNQAIVSDPSLVNQDPEGNGWFFKVKVANADQINELMTKDEYDKFLTESA